VTRKCEKSPLGKASLRSEKELLLNVVLRTSKGVNCSKALRFLLFRREGDATPRRGLLRLAGKAWVSAGGGESAASKTERPGIAIDIQLVARQRLQTSARKHVGHLGQAGYCGAQKSVSKAGTLPCLLLWPFTRPGRQPQLSQLPQLRKCSQVDRSAGKLSVSRDVRQFRHIIC